MYEQIIPVDPTSYFDPDFRLSLEPIVWFDVTVSFDPDYRLIEELQVEQIRDTLKWIPPSEPHTGFVVRVTQGATADPAAEPHDVGLVDSVNLRTLPESQNAAGEVFSFAVAAYNAAGNEGPDGLLENVVLDFTVPGAPSGLELVAS